MKKSKIRSEASSSGGGGNSRGESVVADCGRRKGSCGYCKSGSRTSISHGLWANSITVDDYQELLDRGWRRSGCFLYKPEMERTCCPSYTIRLRAADFAPTKEQNRVYRRMQRFLDGTLDVKNPVERIEEPSTSKAIGSRVEQVPSSALDESLSHKNKEESKAEDFMHHLANQIDKALNACTEGGEIPTNISFPKASVKRVSQAKKKLLVEGSEDLVYTSNIAFQIAAALKRAQSVPVDIRESKSIAEKLANSLNQLGNIAGLSVRACNGHINFYSSGNHVSIGGDGDVQIVTLPKECAEASENKNTASKKCSTQPPSKKRKLEIRLNKSSFDPEEFALYKKYQMKVHNDSPDRVTEDSYRRFLVDTPLVFVQPTNDGLVPPCGFGSFHQQYIIDGQLVAVGVIDILPKCLSSKYLFWDPDYAFLSPGKYSALQEIGWVKETQASCSSLQYYYLGYYIHSCSKMRYKAAYHPSELLCPLRYQWVPFDVSKRLLDKKKYAVLSDYASLQSEEFSQSGVQESAIESQQDENCQEERNDVRMDDDDDEEMLDPESESSDDELEPETSGGTDGDVTNTLIGLRGSCVRYKEIQRAFGSSQRDYLEAQLRRYKRVVGAELSERMAYFLG